MLQSPWALLGALLIAVPIAIHLLARNQSKVQPFPTLRFLDPSRLAPTRRRRLTDIPLLVVRCALVVAAALALAQPLVLGPHRPPVSTDGVARAVLLDTSVSMRAVADSARRVAQALTAGVARALLVPTAHPAQEVAGAVAWLATERGRPELILVSDFQVGTVAAADLAGVPSRVRVQCVRVGAGAQMLASPLAVIHGVATSARATLSGDRTNAEWAAGRGAVAASSDSAVLLLTGPGEDAAAHAAWEAALSVRPAPMSPDMRPVAIVYPRFEGRAALERDAKLLNAAWMGDVIARVRADRLERAAEDDDTAGAPIARWARGTVAGGERLLLFANADPGSVASASLIAGVLRALAPQPLDGEWDPRVMSDAELAALARPAAVTDAPESPPATGASDGRWLWLLVLVLLVVEALMRRASDGGVTAVTAGERAS